MASVNVSGLNTADWARTIATGRAPDCSPVRTRAAFRLKAIEYFRLVVR